MSYLVKSPLLKIPTGKKFPNSFETKKSTKLRKLVIISFSFFLEGIFSHVRVRGPRKFGSKVKPQLFSAERRSENPKSIAAIQEATSPPPFAPQELKLLPRCYASFSFGVRRQSLFKISNRATINKFRWRQAQNFPKT